MAFKDTKHKGFVSNYTGNGIHSFGAFQYFQINDPNGTLDPYTGQVKVLDIATKAGFYSSTDTGSNITEVVYDPYSIAISAENATLSNVTVWSANSILTQGRGDARYQPVGSYLTSANLTWSNLTGKPTFATVATSGSYTDLANTPNLSLYLTTANAATTYLPSANFSFSNLTGKPTTLSGYGITDGLTSATAAATYQTISGMSSYLTTSSAASTYLPSANFTYANLTGKPTLATVATSGNYNDLSNKPASYTLPAATNSTLGGIIVGANLSVSANGTLSANIPAGGGGGFANGDILNGGTF